ncbi:MAG: hypothetical protein ACYCZI_08375 [Metallibacterium scheffleri]|jgi:hypothetical protein|uniref:hypothetical protein n=1 Tax=Metallibacterium scheffleri TaxID=993689 RepID=UPI0023F1BB74|nr:hypothetical protein [Metallibacterium scheffleri]MBU6405448.1 hypothetical protein [Pseudomonadota bacterium]
MNHIDPSNVLGLRRELRALALDEAPPAALWPRIAARLAPAADVAPARLAWRMPWPALAAALLLGVGLALLLPQALMRHEDVAGSRALRTALLQLDQAQASLAAAQRAQPQASFITGMRVQTALQRAAIQQRLLGG